MPRGVLFEGVIERDVRCVVVVDRDGVARGTGFEHSGELGAAAVLWVRERGTARPRARLASTIGLLMILALFFGGFIVIGGEWFQMWRSTAWNGLDPAFRNSVLALLTLVLLHLPQAAHRPAAV